MRYRRECEISPAAYGTLLCRFATTAAAGSSEGLPTRHPRPLLTQGHSARMRRSGFWLGWRRSCPTEGSRHTFVVPCSTSETYFASGTNLRLSLGAHRRARIRAGGVPVIVSVFDEELKHGRRWEVPAVTGCQVLACSGVSPASPVSLIEGQAATLPLQPQPRLKRHVLSVLRAASCLHVLHAHSGGYWISADGLGVDVACNMSEPLIPIRLRRRTPTKLR